MSVLVEWAKIKNTWYIRKACLDRELAVYLNTVIIVTAKLIKLCGLEETL